MVVKSFHDMSPKQLARLECQRNGLDPDAPYVDEKGETRFLSTDLGYWTNADTYELVVQGYMDPPTRKING